MPADPDIIQSASVDDSGAAGVNFVEISADDWTILQGIADGSWSGDSSKLTFLVEAGLVTLSGNDVVLTTFATAWLNDDTHSDPDDLGE